MVGALQYLSMMIPAIAYFYSCRFLMHACSTYDSPACC